MKRALLLVAFIAVTAQAQTSAEFGRYSAGQVELQFKGPRAFSGSLGLMSGNAGRGLLASGGGTLIKDRAWFFASGQRTQVPQFNANVFASPTDRNSVAASFRAGENFKIRAFMGSMHYTGILSPNAYITASATTSKQ